MTEAREHKIRNILALMVSNTDSNKMNEYAQEVVDISMSYQRGLTATEYNMIEGLGQLVSMDPTDPRQIMKFTALLMHLKLIFEMWHDLTTKEMDEDNALRSSQPT